MPATRCSSSYTSPFFERGFFGGGGPPAVYPDLSGVGPTDASGAGTMDYINKFDSALQTATGWIGSWTKALQDSEKKTHAAFMAVRDAYKRAMPGRLIGVSVDAAGKPALRFLTCQRRIGVGT